MAQPTVSVLAWPELVVRQSPGDQGAIAGSLPYGAVVSLGETGPADTVAAVHGHWRSLVLRGHVGWVFDGFVLEGPAPPEQCRSLGDWVATWEPKGPELVEVQSRCDCEDRRITRERAFAREWTARTVDRYHGADWELTLPGVSADQAWMAVRRCLPLPEVLTAAGRPDRAVVVPGEGDSWRIDPGETRLRLERRLPGGREVTDIFTTEDGARVHWFKDEEAP